MQASVIFQVGLSGIKQQSVCSERQVHVGSSAYHETSTGQSWLHCCWGRFMLIFQDRSLKFNLGGGTAWEVVQWQIVRLLIRRPWVWSLDGEGWGTVFLSLWVNSCAFVCASHTHLVSCVRHAPKCAHFTDLTSICCKRVGLTVSGVVT